MGGPHHALHPCAHICVPFGVSADSHAGEQRGAQPRYQWLSVLTVLPAIACFLQKGVPVSWKSLVGSSVQLCLTTLRHNSPAAMHESTMICIKPHTSHIESILRCCLRSSVFRLHTAYLLIIATLKEHFAVPPGAVRARCTNRRREAKSVVVEAEGGSAPCSNVRPRLQVPCLAAPSMRVYAADVDRDAVASRGVETF